MLLMASGQLAAAQVAAEPQSLAVCSSWPTAKAQWATRKDVKEVLSYPNNGYGDTSSLTFFADLLYFS